MQTKISKVAIIYCRSAIKDMSAIELQKSICWEKAKRDNYTVLETITDNGKIGSHLRRDGIQRVIKLVKRHRVNAVYVSDVERLTRNMTDHFFLIELFEENGVKLKAANSPEDNFGSEQNQLKKITNKIISIFMGKQLYAKSN